MSQVPGRVKILRESVARRIAAGEVIDRPFSVVRELLDNSIDAGATEITVEIEGGGIQLIRVSDNGTGMVQEDLGLAILPHATSKISEVEDLSNLHTMGFRGEALPSIAACSKLRILSRTAESEKAAQIIVHGGAVITSESTHGKRGTVIEVEDLFYSVPARRKFLKRPSAETTQCKNTFIEKAAAFPGITFRLFIDKQLALFLPESSPLDRLINLHKKHLRKDVMFEADKDFGDHKLNIYCGTPAIYRRDRKLIQIFVNNRRINEYALQQAVDYGFSEHLPGGNFPIGFIFITIDPGEVDFNIHPAKREVKFRNINSIHKSIVHLIKGTLQNYALKADRASRNSLGDNQRELILSKEPAFKELQSAPFSEEPVKKNKAETFSGISEESFAANLADRMKNTSIPPLDREDTPVWHQSNTRPPAKASMYAAKQTEKSIYGAFERPANDRSNGMQKAIQKNRQYGLNQGLQRDLHPESRSLPSKPHSSRESIHAAAPQITGSKDIHYKGQLFNLFLIVEKSDTLYLIDQHAAHERILYERFSSDSRYLSKQEMMFPADFELEEQDGDLLEQQKADLEAMGIILLRLDQNRWQLTHLPELCIDSSGEILNFLVDSKGSINDLKQKLFATMSCKEAIKDGAILDELTAIDLAAKAFKLENARCPHGRPIWFTLNREELFQLIGRSV